MALTSTYLIPAEVACHLTGQTFEPIAPIIDRGVLQTRCPFCDASNRTGADPEYDYLNPQVHGYVLEQVAPGHAPTPEPGALLRRLAPVAEGFQQLAALAAMRRRRAA